MINYLMAIFRGKTNQKKANICGKMHYLGRLTLTVSVKIRSEEVNRIMGLLRSRAQRSPAIWACPLNARKAARPNEPRLRARKEARTQVGPKVSAGDWAQGTLLVK